LAKHFESKRIYLFDEIFPCDYGFELDEDFYGYVSEFDEIVIADLTLDQKKVKKWIRLGKKVQIFDHHSETQWIEEYEGSVWDNTRCGTKIFWEEYVKPKIGRYKPIIDEFVDLVNTYDLWDKEGPLWDQAVNLNNVLYGVIDYSQDDIIEKLTPFYNLMSKKFSKLDHWRWTQKEIDVIERAHQREEEMYTKAMETISYREDSKGKYFAVIMIGSKVSLVASRILEEQDYLDYLIVINTYGGVTGKLSFRSSRGFICHDICVANGHDAAAGGKISSDDAKDFWENDDLCIRYNDEYDESKPNDIFNRVTYS